MKLLIHKSGEKIGLRDIEDGKILNDTIDKTYEYLMDSSLCLLVKHDEKGNINIEFNDGYLKNYSLERPIDPIYKDAEWKKLLRKKTIMDDIKEIQENIDEYGEGLKTAKAKLRERLAEAEKLGIE